MLAAMAGTRVLEVGSSVTAHYIGRQLALMGAEVLKVEPLGGDPARRVGPFVRDVPHREGSTLFLYLNLGKRGVTLDRSVATGREILGRLAARSDIVLWGDDANAGREAATSVARGRTAVWMLISPYGITGPRAGWTAYGLNIYHAGGEGYLLPGGLAWTRYSDREPIKGAGHLGEFSAGDSMTAAVLLARMLRRRDGKPLVVDASIQEALLTLLRPEYADLQVEGTIASRASRGFPIAGAIEAEDGWVELMVGAVGRTADLFQWMGSPEWAKDYQTQESQRANGARITELIAEWTKTVPRERLYREGQAREIAVGPYLTPSEVLADPQMVARNVFTAIDHPYAGRLNYPLVPYRFTPGNADADGPVTAMRPAPLLGQHNVEVMEGELHFSRREVTALYEAGVI